MTQMNSNDYKYVTQLTAELTGICCIHDCHRDSCKHFSSGVAQTLIEISCKDIYCIKCLIQL